MTFQVTEAMIANVDRSALTPSQRIGSSIAPMSVRNLLMSPYRGLKSQYHRKLDAPRPMTTGRNTTARVKRLTVELRAVSRAMAYPPIIRTGVMRTVYSIV